MGFLLTRTSIDQGLSGHTIPPQTPQAHFNISCVFSRVFPRGSQWNSQVWNVSTLTVNFITTADYSAVSNCCYSVSQRSDYYVSVVWRKCLHGSTKLAAALPAGQTQSARDHRAGRTSCHELFGHANQSNMSLRRLLSAVRSAREAITQGAPIADGLLKSLVSLFVIVCIAVSSPPSASAKPFALSFPAGWSLAGLVGSVGARSDDDERREPAGVKPYTGRRVGNDTLRMIYFHDQTVAVVELGEEKLLLNCELIETMWVLQHTYRCHRSAEIAGRRWMEMVQYRSSWEFMLEVYVQRFRLQVDNDDNLRQESVFPLQ